MQKAAYQHLNSTIASYLTQQLFILVMEVAFPISTTTLGLRQETIRQLHRHQEQLHSNASCV
ncbi:hypothetical protein [Vibrio barjaei]|uniref:hypothetical protein n=1 Tax=Vibrio barjaei TaxID=1676683 RepID=UPI0022852049|nr:hypothetical protein [Vibrio barjaei]MCY9874898.1 hypothetical protein [Vibrio barjaei]